MDQVNQIKEYLAELSKILGLHGGGIEFVSLEYGVLTVKFSGACVGCSAVEYTLQNGVREYLLIKIPDLEDVIADISDPVTHEPPDRPLF